MSPFAPLKNCSVAGCPERTQGGPCPRHAVTREHARGLTGTGARFDQRRWYRTARWQRLRALVLGLEPSCPDCQLEGKRVRTVDVHHRVKPQGDPGLFWSRANLMALCHEHHTRRTQRGE